ncbi:MAG: DM13 domain-containing protein [Leptolyngbya sp. SIO1E4]|nr:DM13 domain-containing protein [Leptolyngbya sp. SIO1E4]
MLRFHVTAGLLALTVTLLAACTPSQSDTAVEPPPAAPEEAQAPDSEDNTASDTPATPPPPEAPAAPTTSRTGTFVSAEHETQGSATLTTQDGVQTLVFDEPFATSDGPDLVVVLHRSATVLDETPPPAYPLTEGDYVVLAPLTATTGSQEYVIPADVNAEEYQSVAIWCQEFNATFGAAALN